MTTTGRQCVINDDAHYHEPNEAPAKQTEGANDRRREVAANLRKWVEDFDRFTVDDMELLEEAADLLESP